MAIGLNMAEADRAKFLAACARNGVRPTSPKIRMAALQAFAPPGAWRSQEMRKEARNELDGGNDEGRAAEQEARNYHHAELAVGTADELLTNGAGHDISTGWDAGCNGDVCSAATHVGAAGGKVALNAVIAGGKVIKAGGEALELVGKSELAGKAIETVRGAYEAVRDSAVVQAARPILGHVQTVAEGGHHVYSVHDSYSKASERRGSSLTQTVVERVTGLAVGIRR